MSRTSSHTQAFPPTHGVEVLLFDLGGVIIDIDPERTTRAFAEMGSGDLLQEHSKATQHELFDRLERGEISANAFREALRKRGQMDAPDRTIDEAWNALLLEVPQKRFQLLQKAFHHYRLHLFSNTNEIHMEGFKRIVEKRFGFDRFRELFEGIHLSYEMGVRKPEKEAFEKLLERIGVPADRILFIDDTKEHVEAAREMGLRAYHLGKEEVTGSEELLLPQDRS